MTAVSEKDWQAEFGVDRAMPPRFFSAKQQLMPSTPQAHLIRRAFDSFGVDGVLCVDHSPLVYFKRVKQLDQVRVRDLHKQFWNHGGAPILVLVSDEAVHVYSGMTRPEPAADPASELPSLVTTLDRISSTLREFLTSVESGSFFRKHERSFNPAQRINRALLENLKDTRDALGSASHRSIPASVLDALLCRLVFTCYLFDRGVIGESYLGSIGVPNARHLRDVLRLKPRHEAKSALYRLFRKLGEDFNGDLFSYDLEAEAALVIDRHIELLDQFFHGTAVRTGQAAFWPYDFGFIPIETISAIYERFLKSSDHRSGAFYTPRFLAEVVLDTALEGWTSLLGKRFFDPACGSGIFLVGLFNRIAEEWKQANPAARNDRKATELMRLLRESLFGVDISETACRIAAFSLYLAYLDQLSPRDIQELQKRRQALPRLIRSDTHPVGETAADNLRCRDFFDDSVAFPVDFSLVVGNPPWGGIAQAESFAGKWCAANKKPVPDKQIAAAFVWKAVHHVASDGRVCFVLPHGVLFNHSASAISFQKTWVREHAVDRVLNLADLRFLLFENAIHPAIVVSYRPLAPKHDRHLIQYWAPKADWTVTRAEVITVSPQDRSDLTVGELLQDLASPDAPQIWKRRYWATPRDWRLLDRLSLLPRLRGITRGSREKASAKRWLMAEGFQPVGTNDDSAKAKVLSLPSKFFIDASSDAVELFLLSRDCTEITSNEISVRNRSNKTTQAFRSPHVLVSKGFNNIAFADFDVSFRHALRGINGPPEDRRLLAFLAGYLRTPLARYFVFHTSSNWGIYRPEVHVEEVLRVPFPLPHQQPNPVRSWQIVEEVASIVEKATSRVAKNFLSRQNVVADASAAIEPLVDEYFDVLPIEKTLIEDTIRVVIPSIQPTQRRMPVAAVKPSSPAQRKAYCDRVCEMLNGWATRSRFSVRGEVSGSDSLGIAVAVLEKVERTAASTLENAEQWNLLDVLDRLRRASPQKIGTLDLVRGVMIFDRNRLYVVKPIGQRHWTQTTAMNDADEIAGTLLMQPRRVEV